MDEDEDYAVNRNALRQIVIALPEDCPVYDNQYELVEFTHSNSYDYHSIPPPKTQYINCSQHLTQNPFSSVEFAVEEKDPEKILDLGLRIYNGCTVEPDVDRALSLWELLVDANAAERARMPRQLLTPSVLGRANSYLADACMELARAAFSGGMYPPRGPGCTRILPSRERNNLLGNDFLYEAAQYADVAAGWGHVSPAVLNIARHLLRLGQNNGVDVRHTKRYEPFEDLWKAWNVRVQEMAEEKRVKDAKAGRHPNAYACAAPGCGVMAKERKAFMRCSGKCPPERKPHYCSKACQKKAWPTHKLYCKPDEELPRHFNKNSLPDAGSGEDALPTLPTDLSAPVQSAEYEGPDRYIEIPIPNLPGRTATIHSRNLTPDALRIMRDYCVLENNQREAERRAQAETDGHEAPSADKGKEDLT